MAITHDTYEPTNKQKYYGYQNFCGLYLLKDVRIIIGWKINI